MNKLQTVREALAVTIDSNYVTDTPAIDNITQLEQALQIIDDLIERVPDGLAKVLPKHRGGYACDRHYVPIWDAATLLNEFTQEKSDE